MKTILIPMLQGVQARSILRTGVFRSLRENVGVRIIFLVPHESKKDYYAAEFPEDERLSYVLIPRLTPGLYEHLFSRLKITLLRSKTLDIKRRMGRRGFWGVLLYVASLAGNRLLAHRVVRQVVRALDYSLVQHSHIDQLFSSLKPDVLFSTHPFGDDEVALLRSARKNAIRTVGFINSWDKLTARSILRLLPDVLLVPNEITKTEAVVYQDVPEDRLIVTGSPQFDMYSEFSPSPKDIFFKAHNIKDTSAALFLYCPMGRSLGVVDEQLIRTVYGVLQEVMEDRAWHMLVRFPPNDLVTYKEHQPNITVVHPGVRFSKERGVDWDMHMSDLQGLYDALYYSTLVICPPSTVSIEAAILDRPIINLGFDPQGDRPGSFLRFYISTHYKRLIDTGGVALPRSVGELKVIVRKYLANSQLDAGGRARIVREQVGRMDGGASRHIVEILVAELERSDGSHPSLHSTFK